MYLQGGHLGFVWHQHPAWLDLFHHACLIIEPFGGP